MINSDDNNVREAKDMLLSKYVTSLDGLPNVSDDESQNTELFRQVLQEHVRMKKVLLKELINGSARQEGNEMVARGYYADEPNLG